MKQIAYLSSLLLLLLCSCSDDILPYSPDTDLPDGSPMEIVAGAEFPELNFGASTRAFSEQLTEGALRDLYFNIFVFDAAGAMLQFIPPSDISIERIDPEEQRVYFRVRNIYSSTQPRRLHFVVTSAPDLREVPGGSNITAMAGENTLMPALVTENETDAYWGMCELPNLTELTQIHLKLIRNFVKLSVSSRAPQGTFRLLGYTVVNRPGKGTVAPYIYKSHSFASFLTPSGDLQSYDDIIAQGYSGVNPTGAEQSMTHTTAAEVEAALAASERLLASGAADTPCYIYERSQSAIASAGGDVEVTYLIILGEYRGSRYYYKIDIGNEHSGIFEYFDLLRNFCYALDITAVEGPGAATVQDAMKGAAHNNVSASVETRDLYSISYRNEKIEVNTTRVIFTEKTASYSLLFRYTIPPAGTIDRFDASQLKVYDLADPNMREYDMSDLTGGRTKAIDLAGEVVESAELSEAGKKWYRLTITTKNVPTDARRLEQNLRIYYAGSNVNLGRTITLMLRRPWRFTNVSNTNPKSEIQSAFTVSFAIPDGLSQSQFPLTLTFESDKQNIYAEHATDLHVNIGPSGFPGGTTDSVILYEWSIEWETYREKIDNGDLLYTAQFRTNTTSDADKSFNTGSIDAMDIPGRNNNYNTNDFCIRIANKGQKYFEPFYVNISRQEQEILD